MRVAQRSTPTRNLHGKPRDALGRRAAEGVPDSQSASERGGSATARKAPRTRLASSGGQLTQRSERDARRAQARAALERNEALVWERKTDRFFKNLAPGAVGRRTTFHGGNTPSPTRPTSAAQASIPSPRFEALQIRNTLCPTLQRSKAQFGPT